MRPRLLSRAPWLALLVGVVAGCDALLGIAEPIDGGAGDTAVAMMSPDGGGPDDAISTRDSTLLPESSIGDALPHPGDVSADTPAAETAATDAPLVDAPVGDGQSTTCDDAGCSTLLTPAVGVTSLWAANGTDVYWTTSAGGVYGCKLPACNPVVPIATGRPGPITVVPSGNGNVYWAEGAAQGPAFCKNTGCTGPVSYIPGTQAASLLTTAPYAGGSWLAWLDTSFNVDDCQLPTACSAGSVVASAVTTSQASFFSGNGGGVFWAYGSTIGGVTLGNLPIPMPAPAGVVGGLASGSPTVWTDPSGLNACPQAGCAASLHLAPAPSGSWTPGGVVRGGAANSTIFWSGVSGLLYCTIQTNKCMSSPFVPTGIPTVTILAASTNAVFWVEPTGIWYAIAPL